jgi:riboflavin kinase / FMN adenylyltransferase
MTEYHATIQANEPIVITIGNFDGIHLGHQRLLHETCEMAQTFHCKPVLVTFSPHTIAVVRPQIELQYLTTLPEKLALAKYYGNVSDSIIITFTPEVAAMSADAFMNDLCQRFSIQGIVIGADFSLGRNRMGNVQFLQHYGQEHGIKVHAVALAEVEAVRISSTHIRTLLTEGNVSTANELLGHPTLASGIVQHGDKRGRQIGFPTANLRPQANKLLPANGVYAAYVHIQNDQESDLQLASTVYKCVVNIGVRPTFNGTERLVEVHLLDTNLDLYDKLLTVEFIAYLRGEQRFSGIDALKAQITTDVQKAHHILTIRRVSH